MKIKYNARNINSIRDLWICTFEIVCCGVVCALEAKMIKENNKCFSAISGTISTPKKNQIFRQFIKRPNLSSH